MTILSIIVLAIVGGLSIRSANRRIDRLSEELNALRRTLQPEAAATVSTPAVETPSAESPRAAEATASTEREDKTEKSQPQRGWTSAPTVPTTRDTTGTAQDPATADTAGGFEQAFGTRWAVWLGGLALAFGAVFLVQYSVQQGYFGPGMRIFLGTLLSVVLLGAGEMLRRRPDIAPLPDDRAVHVPPMLTAAGAIAAYATVYAAYALHGMIGPIAAFVLLGGISVATMLLAGVHASYIAAIGLLGSVLAPALIESETPRPEMLFLYLTFVIGTAIATAELRQWRWLNLAALGASTIWPLLWLVAFWQTGDEIVVGLHLLALYVFQFFWQRDSAVSASDNDAYSPSTFSAALTGTFVVLFLFAGDYNATSLTGFAAYLLISVAAGWFRPGFVFPMAISAPFAVIGLSLWSIPRAAWDGGASYSLTHYATMPLVQEALVSYLVASAAAALLYGLAGYFKLNAGQTGKGWAWVSAFVPLALFAVAYARSANLEQSVPWAALSAMLAIYHGAVTKRLAARLNLPGFEFAAALHATATLAFLAMALAIALREEWLTIALALLIPGVAWIRSYLKVDVLERLTILLAGTVVVRLVFNPYLPDYEIGTTPIFNMLLYTYGAPVAFTAWGAWLYRKLALDRTADILEMATLVLGLVFLYLEVTHIFTGGDAFGFLDDYGLARHGTHLLVWLFVSFVLFQQNARQPRTHYAGAAAILRVLSYAGFAAGLTVLNPLFSADRISEPIFFDRMMLAYLLPAVLAGLYALAAQRQNAGNVPLFMGVAASAAGFAYYSLEIRRFFHDGSIALHVARISEAETYAYSAGWLLLGAALLAAAFVTRLQFLRFASLGLVMLVAGKVFLLDMAGLTGIWRAASFLGLGGALIGLGLFYQRVVFRPQPPSGAG